MMRQITFLLICLTFSSCQSDENLIKKANELAQKFIITDGHVDLPYRLKVNNFRLEKEFIGIPIETKNGDFDFVRAKKGGLDAPFMSIYIPAILDATEGRNLADSLINMVEWIVSKNQESFMLAKTPKDVIQAKNIGQLALPMGMENGSPIDKIEDVRYFKERGISYVTLTHALANKICDSSYDTTRLWQGLSPFGFEVIDAMAQEGIMIDVSHVSDSSFWDVIRHTTVPVIASHSSVRHFTPGFERNMDDEMIKAMKANNGVIMVNFGSSFLDGEVGAEIDRSNQKINETLLAKNLGIEDDEAKDIIAVNINNNPLAFSNVEKVADHIDRIVELAGIDHVGFGSDFDGVGNSLPTGLKDVADYPNLIYALLKRGYTDSDIEKICSGNLFRVWNSVLDYADQN